MERAAHLQALIYISLKFLTIPLNKEQIYPFLKGPRKGATLHAFQNRGPYGNRRPFPEPYLTYSLGSPVEEPSPPGSPHRAPSETDAPFLEPFFIHLSVPGK